MIIRNVNNSKLLQTTRLSRKRGKHNSKITAKVAMTFATSFAILTMNQVSAACSISPNDRYEYIQSINLNGSALTSGNSLKNNDVLELTPGYSNYKYKENWSIWIDLNNNGNFSESNELVFSSSNQSNETISAVLAIPSTASANSADMRVVVHPDDIDSDSCNYSGYGDSQDYSVNVGNGGNTGDYVLSKQPRGGNNEHILSVEINNDEHVTGNNEGYADLTDEKTFSISDEDLITLTPTSNWGTDWAVWIDSDNNGTFDNNEKVFSDSAKRGYAVEGELDLKNINNGTTRMRIAMNGDGDADASGFEFGEIEDYTVNVQASEPKKYGSHVQWEHDSVNVKIFRFKFTDISLKTWPEERIESEMDKIVDYYDKESYGRFDVNYEIYPTEIQVGDKVSVWDNKSSNDWKAYYAEKLIELGESDFWDIDDDTIYLIIAPQISDWDDEEEEWVPYGIKAGVNPGAIRVYDNGDMKSQAGGIAHEMGHAMGLHHAQGLDGKKNVFGEGDYEAEKVTYGNYFSMMGNNAWDFGGFNLFYKDFFKKWGIKDAVPEISKSGTYRIYALDQGSAYGDIGIRLKAGNGDVTYWVEYRTKDGADTDGVLINTEGYFTDNDSRSYYYGTSYLLDMTPNTHPDDPNDEFDDFDDFIDGALVIGKSYTDKWGAFTITTQKTGGTIGTAGAWIEVKVEMH